MCCVLRVPLVRNFCSYQQHRSRYIRRRFSQECRTENNAAENHKAFVGHSVFDALDREPQNKHEYQFCCHIVADRCADGDVHWHRCHQADSCHHQ